METSTKKMVDFIINKTQKEYIKIDATIYDINELWEDLFIYLTENNIWSQDDAIKKLSNKPDTFKLEQEKPSYASFRNISYVLKQMSDKNKKEEELRQKEEELDRIKKQNEMMEKKKDQNNPETQPQPQLVDNHLNNRMNHMRIGTVGLPRMTPPINNNMYQMRRNTDDDYYYPGAHANNDRNETDDSDNPDDMDNPDDVDDDDASPRNRLNLNRNEAQQQRHQQNFNKMTSTKSGILLADGDYCDDDEDLMMKIALQESLNDEMEKKAQKA
jgi:hypothetical protein